MINKLNKCLLVLILLISLVACGNSKTEEQIDVPSAYSINLILDSEYEFKISDKGLIAFSHALDKKNKLFEDLNILDKPYEEAIKQVMSDVYTLYPEKVTNLEFKISGIKDIKQLEMVRYTCFKMGNNFLKLNNLKLDLIVDGINFNDLEKDEFGNIVKMSTNLDGATVEYYFEPSGKIIKTSEIKAGITTTKSYNNDQLVEEEVINPEAESTKTNYDSNGKVTKIVKTTKDGTNIEEEYRDTVMTKQVITNKEGYREESKYNEEGIITAKFVSYKNGNDEKYSYANGKVILSNITFADGSIEESTYDENGKQTSFSARYSNGSTKDVTFNDGIVTKEIYNYPDKHRAEFRYGTNGKKVSASIIDEYQSQIEQTFYDDGTTVKTASTIFVDGRKLEENFSDAGILLNSVETLNDKTVIERAYYANGQVHTESITDSQGQITNHNYDENGKLITD